MILLSTINQTKLWSQIDFKNQFQINKVRYKNQRIVIMTNHPKNKKSNQPFQENKCF